MWVTAAAAAAAGPFIASLMTCARASGITLVIPDCPSFGRCDPTETACPPSLLDLVSDPVVPAPGGFARSPPVLRTHRTAHSLHLQYIFLSRVVLTTSPVTFVPPCLLPAAASASGRLLSCRYDALQVERHRSAGHRSPAIHWRATLNSIQNTTNDEPPQATTHHHTGTDQRHTLHEPSETPLSPPNTQPTLPLAVGVA